MRTRTLMILAAAVLVLGAWVLLVERHGPTTAEAEHRERLVFADLQADRVHGLTIHRDGERIHLERREGEWRLLEPISYPADGAEVSRVLDTLSTLEATRTLGPDEVDPAAYALDEPRLEVVLHDPEGSGGRLAVGEATPLGSTRAVRRGADEEILLVGDGLLRALDREVDAWRSRTVVEVSSHDLAALEVERGGARIHAVRVDGRWRLVEPVEDLADREHLRNLVADLNAMRARHFVDDPEDAALGLDDATVVTLHRRGGEPPTVLELGARRSTGDGSGEVACRRDGADVFWADDRPLVALARAPVRWRSQVVLPFDSWDVERLAVSGDEGSFRARRRDGVWRVGDGGPADGAAILERLEDLAGLEVSDFDLVVPGRPPMGRVELGLGAGDHAETVTFTFYPPLGPGGRALVEVSAREGGMAVDAAAVEGILATPQELAQAPEAAPTPPQG